MTEPCHACSASAIVRFRLLPHKHLAVSKVWSPPPRWVNACPSTAHQQAARDMGNVMKTESLTDEVATRVVTGEGP